MDEIRTVHPAWKVPALIVRAREFDDYRTAIRKRAEIIAFLQGKGVDLSVAPPQVAPNAPPVAPNAPPLPQQDLRRFKTPELLELARSREGFKRSEHGKNKTTLIAFLLGTGTPAPAPVLAVAVAGAGPVGPGAGAEPATFQEIEIGVRNKTIKRGVLLRLARERGWANGAKGKIDELVQFLRTRWGEAVATGNDNNEGVVDEERGEWPPMVDLDKLSAMSVPQIKAILKNYNIVEALPTKKADLVKLFQKNRCNARNLLACGQDEVCDLRNELCRDDLKAKSTRLQQYKFQGRTFWGTNDILRQIRQAVVEYEKNLDDTHHHHGSGGVEETKDSGLPSHHIVHAVPVIPFPNELGILPEAPPAPQEQEEDDQGRVEPVRISDLMEDRQAYLRLLRKAIAKTFAVATDGVHIPPGIRSADGKHIRNRFHLTMEENAEDLA